MHEANQKRGNIDLTLSCCVCVCVLFCLDIVEAVGIADVTGSCGRRLAPKGPSFGVRGYRIFFVWGARFFR